MIVVLDVVLIFLNVIFGHENFQPKNSKKIIFHSYELWKNIGKKSCLPKKYLQTFYGIQHFLVGSIVFDLNIKNDIAKLKKLY